MSKKNGTRINDTHDEQAELARYLAAFRRYTVLTDHQSFLKLLRIYKDPNASSQDRKKAKERIIYGNVLLIVPHARKYAGRGVPLVDLMQEGMKGLMKALERFDEKFGCRFSTYATHWIRSRVLRALVNVNTRNLFRLPVHVHADLKCVQRGIGNAQRRGVARPTAEDVAEELSCSSSAVAQKIDPSKVVQLMQLGTYSGIALDAPVQSHGHTRHDDETDTRYEEITADPRVSVERHAERSRLVDRLSHEMRQLTPSEAFVLCSRFGLHDAKELSFEEIATYLHRTEEGVRQIEKRALRKLKARWIGKRAAQLGELAHSL